jgi:hypothetical protein
MPIFRVTDNQIMWSQTVQNVLHFRAETGGPITRQDLSNHFEAHWIGNIKGMQTASITHVKISVRELDDPAPPFERTINLPGTQGGIDHGLLTVTAEVLRLRSSFTGPHSRGRIYVAGCPNGSYFDGIMTGTRLGLWAPKLADIASFYLPGATSPYRLVISPRTTPASHLDVSSLVMATLVGVQKRRQIGVGI